MFFFNYIMLGVSVPSPCLGHKNKRGVSLCVCEFAKYPWIYTQQEMDPMRVLQCYA